MNASRFESMTAISPSTGQVSNEAAPRAPPAELTQAACLSLAEPVPHKLFEDKSLPDQPGRARVSPPHECVLGREQADVSFESRDVSFREQAPMDHRIPVVVVAAFLGASAIAGTHAQGGLAPPAVGQRIDEAYTRLILQNLQDPRITTELVDHLPASDTVPSPLKFLGRAVGAPGELTYAKDISRYYEALAKAAPTRAKYWKVGTTEEG